MVNNALKQIEGKLLTILDDETLGVDKDNVYLAIALVRKIADNDAIENIHPSFSDYGEIILDIELKNDHSLVIFIDYNGNEVFGYTETNKEIKDFKNFPINGLSNKIKEEIQNISINEYGEVNDS